MKRIIYLCCITGVFVISCKKDNVGVSNQDGPPVQLYKIEETVSGTLYSNCNHAPDSHQKVTLVVEGVEIDVIFTILTTTTYTDAQGRFSFPLNYRAYSSSEPSNSIIYHDSCSVYDWPGNTAVTLVTNDTVHLKLNLQVNNPYTVADTLFYKLSLGQYNFITGPFTSGIISLDVPAWRFRMFKTIDTTKNYFVWAIGSHNLPSYLHPNAVYHGSDIKHVSCSLSDTATIIIN